jgi:hypothetical protein
MPKLYQIRCKICGKECKSQGEIALTEEEMLENIDNAGMPV